MNTEHTEQLASRRPFSGPRTWRSAGFVSVLVAVALGVAACGGGSPQASSHSLSSSTTSSTAGTPSTAKTPSTTDAPSASGGGGSGPSVSQVLQFDQCMRAHGVAGFGEGGGPTPGSPVTGGSGMSYSGNSFDPNSPTVEAAEQACQKYAVASPVSPAGAAQLLAEQLKFAQCMRAHGEPDFPDPNTTGGFNVPSSVDENSPTFQAAEHACGGFPTPPTP